MTEHSIQMAWRLLDQAQDDLEKLRDAVREHRDQRGDDRCWMDDHVLYAHLPEGYTPPVYDTEVQLEHCQQFIACRQDPRTEYVSPQREIERLRTQVGLSWATVLALTTACVALSYQLLK